MKNIITILSTVLLFASCTTSNHKQQKLAEYFDTMRHVPTSVLSYQKLDDCIIAYQDKTDVTKNYNYPDTFSLGKLNKEANDFKYVVHLEGISPIIEYDYVKALLEKYETDSTYVSTVSNEYNMVTAIIYRKTKGEKGLQYAMWKKVTAPLRDTEFTEVAVMNNHLFY